MLLTYGNDLAIGQEVIRSMTTATSPATDRAHTGAPFCRAHQQTADLADPCGTDLLIEQVPEIAGPGIHNFDLSGVTFMIFCLYVFLDEKNVILQALLTQQPDRGDAGSGVRFQ